MISIWVDDIRPCPNKDWASFNTVNDTLKFIRKKYKEGNSKFYLDLDHDASDKFTPYGGDYINILNNLEAYIANGHMKNLDIICHFHSGNSVGIQNMRAIVEHNHWREI